MASHIMAAVRAWRVKRGVGEREIVRLEAGRERGIERQRDRKEEKQKGEEPAR